MFIPVHGDDLAVFHVEVATPYLQCGESLLCDGLLLLVVGCEYVLEVGLDELLVLKL